MKKIKQFLVLLMVALLTVTCKKEHIPASTIGAPEFYFNGTVNGISTSLNAGVNNYYMYSSYVQDSNNVYNFIGNLKQTNSNLNNIQIQINDYKVSVTNASVQIDSSLSVKNYTYFTGGSIATTTVYNVQFNSAYTNANGSAQSYNWNFGDGSTSTIANPMHTYSQLGYYNVCLTIAGSNGCSNSICDTVNLASPTAYACHTVISSTVTGNTVYFSNTPSGTPPFLYSWNFGDSSSVDTSHVQSPGYTYASPGVYQVSLSVKDSLNNTTIAKYNVGTATAATATCLTNFSVGSIQPVTTTGNNVLGLGNVTVKWTDASGITYSSNNNTAQPASSYFKILSEEAYQNNINGQLTRKIHVQFTCTLYCTGHIPIQIANGDAVIAVAYK